MPCNPKLKHDTALGMYHSITYGLQEYTQMVRPFLHKAGFTEDIRALYHPDVLRHDMHAFQRILAKKYLPKEGEAILRQPEQRKKKVHFLLETTPTDNRLHGYLAHSKYHQRRAQVLRGIQDALDSALLEFKMAVVDYIKQDGIQPGCLGTKQRAVLYLVDRYYQQLAQQALQQEGQSRHIIASMTQKVARMNKN